MGKLFNSAKAPPPPSSAVQTLMSAQHTSGIYADMTVDGDDMGALVVVVDRAKNLPNLKTMGKQDPYCAARLGKEAKKTDTDRRGGQTPRWDQELRFTVRDGSDYGRIKISVFNDDKKTDLIGECWVMLDNVLIPGGGQADSWHNLTKQGKYAGEIRIELTFYDTRPKQEKAKKIKSAEMDDEVQRAASIPGPRELPMVRRRPLPEKDTPPISSHSSPAPTQPSGAFPTPMAGPRSFHTPPRHASNAYEDEFPTPIEQEYDHGNSIEHVDGYEIGQTSHHPHARSMPDILSSQYPEPVAPAPQDRALPHQQRHSFHDAYDEFDHGELRDEQFPYSDDPYALQAADAVQDEPPRHHYPQSKQTSHQQQMPPRHGRIAALASDGQDPHRPLPHPSHSAPLLVRQDQVYPGHQESYHSLPSYESAPANNPAYGRPQRAHTFDDYSEYATNGDAHAPRDMQGPPPPPRHRNSVPAQQYQAHRPQPVHYSSQPVAPVATPPYPRNRDSYDPSSQHASRLRDEYAAVSDPRYHPRPRQQPQLPHGQGSVPLQQDRRRSAEPGYSTSHTSFNENVSGHMVQREPQHQYTHSYSSPIPPRSNFQHSEASSAALRTPHSVSAEHQSEEPVSPHENGSASLPRRVNASNATLYKPQPRALPTAQQQQNQPIIINGTVALATRASPIYNSSNPKQHIPRRSISPNASTEALGSHYSPDSYDIYNPTARSSAPESSPLAHRSPSPMYSQEEPSPEPTSHTRRTPDGNVILSDGKIVHPSDHIPSSSWAPEPEPKGKRPTVAVNIRNRFGPRDARTLDKSSNVVISSPLAGAGMRKQADAAPINDRPVRITQRRMEPGSSPLGPGTGRENVGYAPPPIPAKVPLENTYGSADGETGSLANEMAKIDLGPRSGRQLGWGRGNRWGV